MAGKTKKKVVDITEEAKKDIAVIDEEEKEATDNVQPVEDICTSNNPVVCTEDNKVDGDTHKKGKIKGFLKRNWPKLLTGGISVLTSTATYFIGKKSGALTDEQIKELGQEAIKDYWRRINQMFKDDPDQAYAVSVTDPSTNKVDWLEVTPVDSIPEWIDENKDAAAEF